MRKFILILALIFATCSNAFAAKIPSEVKDFILNSVPNTDIRFDGVIILPDNTIYLPLYPSLFSDVKNIEIKESYPENQNLAQKPDIVIFNNDFVLLKLINIDDGRKTVKHIANPPLQVRTGLLPQGMLVPSGLVLPENLKGIIGNLKIDTQSEDIIKQNIKESFEEFLANTEGSEKQSMIPFLKNKTLFVTTNYSKNIQVLDSNDASSKYSLAQKSIPIDMEATNKGKFLLVTSYERPFLDVISVADSRYIKQIDLAAFPEEIVIDENSNKAYITSPTSSTIFVIDLKTMTLIQKIRVNGYCENLILTEGKIFYVDKLKNEIWAIELDNNYELVDIGVFPNVSSLAFVDNKLYISSRTKSRVAVVDYTTLGLLNEFTTVSKPIALQIHKNNLYVLGAQNNQIQILNTDSGRIIDTIDIGSEGFSTGFNKILGTDYVIITDIKKNKYSILDLEKGKILLTNSLNVPIKAVVIADKVKLFD